MSSVRRSKWPLLALTLALMALAGGQSRGEDAGAPDMQLRSATSSDDGASLPEPSDKPDETIPKPKPKSKGPPKPKAGDLPPLKPYRGAQRLGLRGGPPDPKVDATGTPIDITPPGPAVAAIEPPPPRRRKTSEDEKPFDPIGLRIGDVVVKPYVEQDAGYATNPLGATAAVKGSFYETTEVGADWQSDWSRNDLHGELKGGYNDYFAAPEANGPYASGTADYRVDVTYDLTLDTEGRFSTAPQSLSNFGVPTGPSGTNPYIEVSTYGATLGATQALGKLSLGLHGTYDREDYQNAVLSGLGTKGLSADDYNDFGLKFRTGYRVTEALSPFVELGADRRLYDSGTDALGYARDSTGVTGKAGFTLGFSEQLTGEASVGYGVRDYQDPRLPTAVAPLYDASLIWSATPLTTLTLKAQTTLNDSILAGASADINHTYTLDLSHALTRAVTLGLTGTYGTDEFVGVSTRDVNETLGVKAEYHINRNVVLKASATRQIYQSTDPNQVSLGDVFLLGVRLQR